MTLRSIVLFFLSIFVLVFVFLFFSNVAVAIGILVFIIGLLAKIVIEVDELRHIDLDMRARAWFRYFALGPDLCLFGASFLIGLEAIRKVVKNGEVSGFVVGFFWLALCWSVLCFLANVVFFLYSGPDKKLPLTVRKREDGAVDMIPSPDFTDLMTSKECYLVLVLGNGLGLSAIVSTMLFLTLF